MRWRWAAALRARSMATSLTYVRQTGARWCGWTRAILGRRKALNWSHRPACQSSMWARVGRSIEFSCGDWGVALHPTSANASEIAPMISARLDSFTRFSRRPEKYRRAVRDCSLGSLMPKLLTKTPSICPLVGSCGVTSCSITLSTWLLWLIPGTPVPSSGPSYQSYRPFLDKNFSESTDTSFNASSTPTSMMERP